MMNKKEIANMIVLRMEGKTFQEIGDEFGVSKQYVHHILCKLNGILPKYGKTCVYPNLQEWLDDRDLSISAFGRMLQYDRSKTDGLRKKLKGDGVLNFNEIVRILEITGMTFEKCFLEGREDV